MQWVYGHCEYFTLSALGDDFRRQILTPKVGLHAERVKHLSIPVFHFDMETSIVLFWKETVM